MRVANAEVVHAYKQDFPYQYHVVYRDCSSIESLVFQTPSVHDIPAALVKELFRARGAVPVSAPLRLSGWPENAVGVILAVTVSPSAAALSWTLSK